MLDVFSHPEMMHAAAAHMPVAFSILGVPLVLFAFVVARRNKGFLGAAAAWYVVLAVLGWLTGETGEKAREQVPPTIGADVADLIVTHASMADRLWIFAIVTAVFLAASLLKFPQRWSPWIARTVMLVGILMSAATAGWVAQLGHYGGELVYTHGIGTAMMHKATTPATTTAGGGEATGGSTDGSSSIEESAPVVAIRDIDMEEAHAVSFTKDVWPILERSCLECHEGLSAEGDWEVTSVDYMLEEGKKAGPGVIPGEPDNSSMVKYIRGEFNPIMPEDADPLTEDELHVIRLWIAAGAIDDTPRGS
jgi:uncharacterized membrane protein